MITHPLVDPSNLYRPAWLIRIDDISSRVDNDSIALTVEEVLLLCSNGHFEAIDFSRIDPSHCNLEHLIAALRAASYFCDVIPSWIIGVEAACTACIYSGINPDDILFGLN